MAKTHILLATFSCGSGNTSAPVATPRHYLLLRLGLPSLRLRSPRKSCNTLQGRNGNTRVSCPDETQETARRILKCFIAFFTVVCWQIKLARCFQDVAVGRAPCLLSYSRRQAVHDQTASHPEVLTSYTGIIHLIASSFSSWYDSGCSIADYDFSRYNQSRVRSWSLVGTTLCAA